ncbi:MAG: Lrp/AsnC family transcriptional regulator [Proteobacteria bacterium]|nr:Lrp/AsnC family transcriptional regulator [Pseudomonadota bacterium]
MIHKLDKIDLKILSELQENGRITNIELSKRVGISAPPCLRRVKNLEDAGLISSYHAVLNAPVLGFSVTIFCEVGLNSQNESDLRSFEEIVQKWPLIRECYMITGGYDFLVKIVTHDFDEYQQFLSTYLAKLENVNQIKTRMVVRSAKKQSGIPVELIR